MMNVCPLAPSSIHGTGISTKVHLGLEHFLPIVTNGAGAQGLLRFAPSKMTNYLFLVNMTDVKETVGQIRAAFSKAEEKVAYPPFEVPIDLTAKGWDENGNWIRALTKKNTKS